MRLGKEQHSGGFLRKTRPEHSLGNFGSLLVRVEKVVVVVHTLGMEWPGVGSTEPFGIWRSGV